MHLISEIGIILIPFALQDLLYKFLNIPYWVYF